MERTEGVRCQNCANGKESDSQEQIKCNASCCDADTGAQSSKKRTFKTSMNERNEGVRCQNCADGKEYDSQEQIKCNASCCDANTGAQSSKKNVQFSNEDHKADGSPQNRYELLHLQNPKDSAGICLCCREGECAGQSTEVGRRVLVYELPEPKFDDLTINKRDYGPKPLQNRDLPPWHPIIKDRWRSLRVPSLNKTTYQHDYTPPIIMPHDKKKKSMDQCIYLTEDDKRFQRDESRKHEEESRYEQTEPYQVWRKTTVGPGEVIEVCDKPYRQIPVTEIHKRPTEPAEYHAEEEEVIAEQLHGPQCEKHCYSTPLMCHVKKESQEMKHPTSVKAALAAMAIETNHLHHGGKKVHFAPEICHVEPLKYGERHSKGDRIKSNDSVHFQTEKRNGYAEEFGDCKHDSGHHQTFSTEQQKYSFDEDGRQGYSNGMDQGQSSNAGHQGNYYNSPICGADCSKDTQMHYLDCDDHRLHNYPMYPGTSPAAHVDAGQSHSQSYEKGCPKGIQDRQSDDSGRGLKDTQRYRETSRKVSFEDVNDHSRNGGPSHSDNNNVQSGRHGLVHGPSLLGHSHSEGPEYVALPICAEACPTAESEEDNPDSTRVRSTGHQGHDPLTSGHRSGNEDSGIHGSEKGMKPRSCTRLNEFTLCENMKSNQSGWWKSGGYDQAKGKGSYEYEEVPNQLMKPYRPPYTTMTRHDFKQPIAGGQRESCRPKRDPNNECGCTEKREINDFPKFERGGLI